MVNCLIAQAIEIAATQGEIRLRGFQGAGLAAAGRLRFMLVRIHPKGTLLIEDAFAIHFAATHAASAASCQTILLPSTLYFNLRKN